MKLTYEALYKTDRYTGKRTRNGGTMIITCNEKEFEKVEKIAQWIADNGFEIDGFGNDGWYDFHIYVETVDEQATVRELYKQAKKCR